MKRLAVIFLIFLLLGAAVYYFLFRKTQEPQDQLVLYGNVDIRQVDLGFRVFGRVDHLYFDEGDYVQHGQLMASLDKIPYEELVMQAEGALMTAEANLQDAEVKLQRRTGLPPSVVSQEDYDNALYSRNALAASYHEAKAALQSQQTNLHDASIYCPTDGWILTRIREPGSIVNVGDPVFTLSVKSPVWIRAYVSEPQLGKIYPGMPAKVCTDTRSMPTYEGHIGFISPVAEFTPKTVETTDLRTDLVYRLRVIIDKPDKWLRQGMPVTVILPLNADHHD